MAIERILPTNPRIKVEVINMSNIQDIIARVYIEEAGVFKQVPGFIEFFGSSGTSYQHLTQMLYSAGRIDIDTQAEAIAWLQTTPKGEAMNFLKTIWRTFLQEICALINSALGGVAPSPGEYFITADELFQTLLNSSNFTIVDGKLTATI